MYILYFKFTIIIDIYILYFKVIFSLKPLSSSFILIKKKHIEKGI